MTYFPALLIVAVSAGSCESVIKFKGEGVDPKIVIYSLLHPDSLIKVSVAVSHAVYEERYEPEQITDAVVRLFRDGELIETLAYVPSEPQPDYSPADPYSRYASRVTRPDYGSTYRIEVEIPGLKTASGEARLPELVPVTGIDTSSVIREGGHRQMEVKIKFRDPAGTDNFYRLSARGMAGTYYGDKQVPYLPFIPVMVAETDLSYGVLEEPLITPRQEDDIFGMDLQNNYKIFMDELISGKEYALTMQFNLMLPDTDYYEFAHASFSLHSITRDLYLFLQSNSAHMQTRENFLAEPVLVYTNITNGLGVMGAMSTSAITFKIGEYPVEGVLYESYAYYK
ncbi:MAG: DUF4249 domain-containing protein [Marinilabiliales bacterium]|nr:DUF4249 domain-containing protein [Marinilabiliales bacterium]